MQNRQSKLSRTKTYSDFVIGEGSRLLFVSGQVPVGKSGAVVDPGDIKGQIRQIFENIQSIVTEAGCTMSDIVKLSVFDTDIDAHVNELREVKQEVFGGGSLPASTKVQVSRLADPRYLLEIEAIAIFD